MALNIKQITNSSQIVKNTLPVNGYKELELGNVIKFGYICEQKGISFPIYLKIDNIYEEIRIGKTGMFEISTNVGITAIKVPDKISFSIDYICD